MRRRNIAILVIAAIILIPLAALLIFIASFNPNRYKPQIIAAAERATGRQVAIAGDLRMNLSLSPTISASDITVANPPGFPDATMATLRRIQAQVALLPLLGHRIDIVNLTLVDPAITLERNAAGQGNWVFAPAPGAHPAAPVPAHSAHPPVIALQAVSIRNGVLTMKQGAASRVLTIARLTARAATLASALHLKARAAYDGQPFTIDGKTGPLSRFSTGGAGPWPLDAAISAAGATLHVKGTVAHPRQLAGYDLALAAAIPDLAALDPYLGGYDLPPLKSLDFSGRAVQSTALVPAITDAKLNIGASDLGTLRPGLRLASLRATMKSLSSPLSLNASGSLDGKALALSGTMGPLARLIPPPPPTKPPASAPPPQPDFTVDLTATAGNAHATIGGGIKAPLKLAGVALKIGVQIPDLSHLAPLAGRPLPALTHVDADLTLTDPGGQGLRKAIGLESIAFSADQAQIGGAASIAFGKLPNLQAILNAPRIDLSALLAAEPKPAEPKPAEPKPAGAAPAPPAQNQPASSRIIPDTPLPFNLLRQAEGNVELSIGQLIYRNARYDAIQAHGLLRNGVLTVRPIAAQLPGGSVAGTLEVNAAAAPPRLAFTAAAPAFGLSPLLASLGLPHSAAGTAQIYADLAGQGQTPHDIAASLNGQLGVSLVNGEVDGAVVNQLLGKALNAAGLPPSIAGAQGPVLVRCFATLIDSANGVGALRAFTLDSSRVFLTGTGNLDFGPEALNLVLRPQVRMGNGAIPLPVHVGGSFAHPSPGPAPAGDYGATAAAIGQRFAGHGGSVLGNLARRLGIAPPPPSPQSCTGALALARMGHPGPAPAPAPAAMPTGNSPGIAPAPPGAAPAPSGPQNLLQSLFR